MRFAPRFILPLLVAASAAAQDNILILVADDLGVDMVGAYGEGSPPPTPVLDGLAEAGVLFRNAWSNPMCSPTRACLQTGRYPFRTHVGTVISAQGAALDPAQITLPELLDLHPRLDFADAAFGKWHLGNAGTGGALAPNLAGYSHFEGTVENIRKPDGYYDWPKVVNGVERRCTVYATTDTVDAALEWLADAPEPWLCYVAFNAPHNPFHAPPAELHSIDLPHVEPRVLPRPFYMAMVQAMDAEIGRLLDGLGDGRERTNVIFLGDNGTPKLVSEAPFLPEHAKLTPYEGGINVPFILSGPAVRQPGREVEALVSMTDVFATVAELAGVDLEAALPADYEVDSVSFAPYLADPRQKALRETVYSGCFAPNGAGEHGVEWHMVRDERYKLIARGPAPFALELYDLLADPFEERDLLSVEPSAAELAALERLIHALRVLLP